MKLSLLAALGLIAVSCYSAPSAEAQGFSIDTKKLQKPQTQFYKGELQILDAGPAVKDLRTAPQGPNNVVLNLAPLPATPGSTMVVNLGSPGGAAPGGQGVPAGQFVVDPLRAPAGFMSNMNSLKSPVGLPSGHTTNRLGNSAIGNVHGQLKTPARPFSTQPAQAQPQLVASRYQPYKTGQSISSGSNMQTSVGLSGRILTARKSK